MEDCQHILKAVGAFDYVAATKLISKVTKIYQPIGNIFTRLCSSESSFTQLQFLRSRWFVMRKDTSVEVVYTNLAAELPKEILNITTSALSNEDKNGIIVIMDALHKFCLIRRDLINIYQAILAQSTRGDFDEVLKEMESLQQRTKELDLEKDLLVLGLGVEKEINILTSLLRAKTAITNYAFQDSCITLFEAKQDLTEWKRVCQEQDYPEKSSSRPDENKEVSTWRFPLFGGSAQSESRVHKHGDIWPNTIRWHARVLANLTAKMTLFFNAILLEKESMVSEEDPQKSLWKGLRIDYYDQISTFKKKFGAHSISLVYEVTKDTPFYPQGYVCCPDDSTYEAPQGVHSFPFIYCHPKEAPNKHLPNIISIIQGSRHKLSDPKTGPIHFFDTTIGSTYYIMRIDIHTVLVIIYLDKHSHRDPTTLEFMTNVVTSLRGSTVIEELIRVD